MCSSLGSGVDLRTVVTTFAHTPVSSGRFVIVFNEQIYDEYGLDALRVFEQREKSKTSVGAPLKHPAQV